MEFFIRKSATLPIMKMELIHDGRNNFQKFFEKVQNSNITFCMKNVVDGKVKVGNKSAMCILKEGTDDEYYIAYQFSARDTNTPGRYVGEFVIDFLDDYGVLVAPVRDELFVNILEGSIRK